MKEQFVTYDIALKLKELVFDKISRFGNETSLYTKEGKYTFYANYGSMYPGLSGDYIYAPIWQQVFDWFLNQSILIEVFPVDDWDHWSFRIHGKDISCPFYKMYNERDEYDTYEQAREQSILKAIELCQKKLLKVIN